MSPSPLRRAARFLHAFCLLTIVRLAAGQTAGVEFFETKVRPLLVAKCQGCHGVASHMAGLDLSSSEGFGKGADSGVLISGSDPAESRLMRAIGYEGQIKMPPTGRLKAEEIAAIREWIEMGAPWPAEKAKAAGAGTVKPVANLTEQRKFWSFQPVRKTAPPAVKNRAWTKNPIDAFIFSKLEEKHLQPAPPADKVTLLRRATFDLTGLPPTEAEIRGFLAR